MSGCVGYHRSVTKSLAKFARPTEDEAIVGKMAQRVRAEALNSAFSPHRRRKPKAQKVELDDPIYPWRRLWKFVGHTGYRDWLAARGVTPADIEKRISDEFNRTTTDIDFKDGELTVTVKTRSIGDVRRRKTVQKFPVDGETTVFLDSPSGSVSIVTLFQAPILRWKSTRRPVSRPTRLRSWTVCCTIAWSTRRVRNAPSSSYASTWPLLVGRLNQALQDASELHRVPVGADVHLSSIEWNLGGR